MAALAISGLSHAGSISPIPDVTSFVSVGVGPGTGIEKNGSGRLSVNAASSRDPSIHDLATAQVFTTPDPSLLVHVAGQNEFLPGSAAANANLLYYFTVAPPTSGTAKFVPLDVNFSIQYAFDADHYYTVDAGVQVDDIEPETTNAPFVATICKLLPCNSFQLQPQISYNQIRIFQVGDVYSVGLNASVAFGGTDFLSSSYSGSVGVDPTFTIDPTFLAQNPGYSLVFSSGIGNTGVTVSDTPEPATWALMLAGFIGLGASIRTRRGK
jgi:hypothetical protein